MIGSFQHTCFEHGQIRRRLVSFFLSLPPGCLELLSAGSLGVRVRFHAEVEWKNDAKNGFHAQVAAGGAVHNSLP